MKHVYKIDGKIVNKSTYRKHLKGIAHPLVTPRGEAKRPYRGAPVFVTESYSYSPTLRYNIFKRTRVRERHPEFGEEFLRRFPGARVVFRRHRSDKTGRIVRVTTEIVDAGTAFREQFLGLIAQGMTQTMACIQLGISTYDLKKILKSDPEFKRMIDSYEDQKFDLVEGVLYMAAVGGGPDGAPPDVGAANAYISAKLRRKELAYKIRMASLEYRLKKDAYQTLVNTNTAQKPQIHLLTNAELAKYDDICKKVERAEALTDDEALALGRLNAKMAGAATPEGNDFSFNVIPDD